MLYFARARKLHRRYAREGYRNAYEILLEAQIALEYFLEPLEPDFGKIMEQSGSENLYPVHFLAVLQLEPLQTLLG